jgi:plastocyanin domain-containing protein
VGSCEAARTTRGRAGAREEGLRSRGNDRADHRPVQSELRMTKIVVTLAGLAAIVLVNWYFLVRNR